MSVMILDAGNSIIKAKIARRQNGEIAFPHAIHQLSEGEYQNIVSRPNSTSENPDYLRVNGKPYVVGNSAEKHGVLTQRSGASRYTRDYYGILASAALGRLYERGGEVKIFGSHAPGDVRYRDDLMHSVIGDWEIEICGKEKKFKVVYVNTFDEPVGGLMNVLLTEDGQHYQYTDINGGRSLVIDIGGFTTDWIAVNPGGEVDYSLARSIPIGIQEVISDFIDAFRSNNLDAVKNSPTLPQARVRQAMISGVFEGGGRKYPCKVEMEEASNRLLNQISNTYQHLAGGALNWDTIILTGGGSGLLFDKLIRILNHDHIVLADQLESLHMANVRGGLKLWRLFEALSVI